MNKQDEIQQAALEKIKLEERKYKNLALDIGTGVGKSLLIIKDMIRRYHDCSTFLIVVPRVSLIKNWNSEFKKHNTEFLIAHTSFQTYRSYHKTDKEYDCVYLDEAHNLKSIDHYIRVKQTKSPMIAVTGTYPSHDQLKNFEKHFIKIFEYKTRTSVNDNLLNDYRIIIHKIPISKTLEAQAYSFGKVPESLALHKINAAIESNQLKGNFRANEKLRITRMKIIQGFDSKLLYSQELIKHINSKILIFTESKIHCEKVCENYYHSKNSKVKNEKLLKDFNDGTILKLSAIGQLSEGVNIDKLQNILILHTYSNKTRATQKIGRALRLGANSGLIAYIHILVYENTIDEVWCKNALEDFDSKKIGYFDSEKTKKLLNLAGLC